MPITRETVVDQPSRPGGKIWAETVRRHLAELLFLQKEEEQKIRFYVDEIHTFQAWKILGYPSFKALAETPREDGGLGAVPGTEQAKRLTKAQKEALKARTAGEYPTHADAGAKGGRGRKASDNVTGFRGNTASYLARRLLRDAPEVFARLERGEFKSVRAAAREAGIVRDPTGLERLWSAWRKASEAERKKFLSEVDHSRG